MSWLPPVSALVVQPAVYGPEPVRATAPQPAIGVPPSVKATVPPPSPGETVAVKVTAWPEADGFADEATAVWVATRGATAYPALAPAPSATAAAPEGSSTVTGAVRVVELPSPTVPPLPQPKTRPSSVSA